MPDAWFVVPVAEFDKPDGQGGVATTVRAPKYKDTEGITAMAGLDVDSSNVPGNVPHNDAETFVVRFYGTQDALNTVQQQSDVRRLGNRQTAAQALDNEQGRSRSAEEVEQAFRVGSGDGQ